MKRQSKRESSSNVFFTCKEHSARPNPALHGHPPIFYVDKFVKLGFPTTHPQTGKLTTEHMWVKVREATDNGHLVGVLDNDPVTPCDYAYGDVLEFEIPEIEDLFTEEAKRTLQ